MCREFPLPSDFQTLMGEEIPWGTSSPPALDLLALPSPTNKDLPLIDMKTTVAFSETHTLGGIL